MATDYQKAQETYELFRFCRDQGGHAEFLKNSEIAQRYYASRQWLDADVRKRTEEGRLSFTVNEIFRTINAVRGELSNLSTDVRFDPSTGGSQETASVLNKLSEHVDRLNKSYMVDDTVRLHGLLTGRGYWEVRVDFSDNLQGNIVRTWKRPQNVILDADIDSMDPQTWGQVFTTEIVSLDDIKNMYGARVAKDMQGWPMASFLDLEDRNLAQSIGLSAPLREKDVNSSDPSIKQYRLISRQYREYKYKDFFVDLRTGDMSEIPENWEDEKVQYALTTFNLGTIRRKAKTIRWCVTCNDRVLHDEDSPYKFFTIVPYFPYFLDGHPISLFDILRGPQDMLNYTVSEELQILGTTSHSGWKVKQGSLKNMTMRQLEEKGSKNGLVMELEEVNDAERITPGQPASGFERLGDRSRNWIMELANVTPSMLGNEGQYAAGKGMNTQLSRAPVNLSSALTAYQFSMHTIAEIKLNLFQTYYTETRTLRISKGSFGEPEEVTINQPTAYDTIANDLTVGEYTVRMMPATSRTAADEFAFDELLQLKEIGLNVPNSLFVMASSLQAKTDMIDVLIQANNGEISPEEQRAQQLQLDQLQADLDNTIADTEFKRAQSELNSARAQKNLADASYNPHADRIALDRDRLATESQLNNRRLDLDNKKVDSSTGLKLTEIAQKSIDLAKKHAAQNKQRSSNTKQPRRGK